jgi:SAM-dependent methyltransferase
MRKRSSYSSGSPQVEPSHYARPGYDYKGRFISYWHQIDEIVQQRPATTLEIGIGNGFVSSYLRERGYAVTTVDHDRRLGPDITASVLALPLQDECFDVVACFEVLEHLPFEAVPQALSELRRVSRRSVLISIPDTSRAYPSQISVPKLGQFRFVLSLPRIRLLRHRFDGQHYWVVGEDGYPMKRIEHELSRARLDVRRTYRPFENHGHRFFITERR